jgi:FtsZ-binding cell division protein ZapB
MTIYKYQFEIKSQNEHFNDMTLDVFDTSREGALRQAESYKEEMQATNFRLRSVLKKTKGR